MVKLKDLEDVAIEMARIYDDYSKTVKVGAPDGSSMTESYVTDEGLEKLRVKFDAVDINERTAIFSLFLDKLTDMGYGANIEQFQGTVH